MPRTAGFTAERTIAGLGRCARKRIEVGVGRVAENYLVVAGASGVVTDWLVDDFDEVLAHMQALGASLYRGPLEIENGFRMCKLKDPFGNLLGLRGR